MNIQMYEFHGINIYDNKQVIFHNQKTKIFQKLFLLHINFFEKIFCSKKIGDKISKQICLFLYWLSFLFSYQQTIHSFSNILTI